MKAITRISIKEFLISGFIYTILMAGFDYLRGREFDIWKFLFDFFIFDFVMSIAVRTNRKNQETQNNSSKINKTRF